MHTWYRGLCSRLAVASFLILGDTPTTMGMRADNLWSANKTFRRNFAPGIAGLCLAGILVGAWIVL